MAALGRIMKYVRAHSGMGSTGDVDPAHLSLSIPPVTVRHAVLWLQDGVICCICLVLQAVLSGLLQSVNSDMCCPLVSRTTLCFTSLSLYILVSLPQNVPPTVAKEEAIQLSDCLISHCCNWLSSRSLFGLDNCTEIEVQWPCGTSILGNCESLTTFKVDLFSLQSLIIRVVVSCLPCGLNKGQKEFIENFSNLKDNCCSKSLQLLNNVK